LSRFEFKRPIMHKKIQHVSKTKKAFNSGGDFKIGKQQAGDKLNSCKPLTALYQHMLQTRNAMQHLCLKNNKH